MLRAIAAGLSALLLTACDNMVVSQTPVVTALAAVEEPRLKDGVWERLGPDACPEDMKNAPVVLADCRFLVVGESLFGIYRTPAALEAGAADGSSFEAFYIDAGPNLFGAQIGVTSEGDTVYAFAVLARRGVDAEGRTTEIIFNLLACGPPSNSGRKNAWGMPVTTTETPFVGAVMVDENCRPDGVEGLRLLARENLSLDPMKARWVRSATPGEIEAFEDEVRKSMRDEERSQSTIEE
ncbi:MAG TPA: hypothetical protein VEA44_18325 [Caulobacter sp.]|nr:hypothetical protein [Caulobacter sp.]